MKKVLTLQQRYTKAIENTINEFDKIDKDTPWQEVEPKWWLDMMELSRDMIKRKGMLQ